MNQFSDEKIRISYGTGIVLGLIKARQDVAPTTAYLLWDKGCIGSCSFCPRANGNQREERLSRIIWPEYSFKQILELLTSQPKPFERVCLQTGFNPDKTGQLKVLAQTLVKNGLTTSVTLSPSQTDLALELLDYGIDHIGIGLDGASENTYSLHKRKNWHEDWPKLLQLISKAKEKIEVHLIYGLGDSEEAFCKTISAIIDAGGRISLFALTPVNGGNPPDLSEYRRIQIFRYLYENSRINLDQCNFNGEKLVAIKTGKQPAIEMLDSGACFRTSGCGNCNRPYYNEKPGQKFFNFPRSLTAEEFSLALDESGLFNSDFIGQQD